MLGVKVGDRVRVKDIDDILKGVFYRVENERLYFDNGITRLVVLSQNELITVPGKTGVVREVDDTYGLKTLRVALDDGRVVYGLISSMVSKEPQFTVTLQKTGNTTDDENVKTSTERDTIQEAKNSLEKIVGMGYTIKIVNLNYVKTLVAMDEDGNVIELITLL